MATVAVVNDDVDALELMARIIERDGHSVHRLDNVVDAQQTVAMGGVTLAVLDLHRAGAGAARTLLADLRATIAGRELRAVIVGRNEGAGLLAWQAGADGYLVRPFHANDLCRAIDEALARPDAEREGFRSAQITAIATS